MKKFYVSYIVQNADTGSLVFGYAILHAIALTEGRIEDLHQSIADEAGHIVGKPTLLCIQELEPDEVTG